MNDITKGNILEMVKRDGDIVIVDVSYHMYRFLYVNSELSANINGFNVPTGHIYGFVKMMCYLRRNMGNPSIILCVDGYDRDRKLINNEYKAGRDNANLGIHALVPDVMKMSSLVSGVYVSHHPDYEADDTIYNIATTLNRLLEKNKVSKNIYIYGTDKDLWQGIGGKVKVVKKFGSGRKNFIVGAETVDCEGVYAEFGVYPKDLAKFRSLVGDSSDKLKGYRMMPKKVAAVIATYMRIETLEVDKSIHVDEGFVTSNVRTWINKVNENPKLFWNNYKIMKLKEYDFVIEKRGTEGAAELIRKYMLKTFEKELEVLEGFYID